MKALIHGQSILEAQGTTLDLGSSDLQVLMRVVERCRLEIRDACLQLTYLVNMLMLATQMNRYRSFKHFGISILMICRTMQVAQKPKYTIFTELQKYVERCHPEISDASTIFSHCTLNHYFIDGMSIAALCGAGFFYILILLACSRAQSEICKIDRTMINHLAKLIRCSTGIFYLTTRGLLTDYYPDTPEGRLVKEDIMQWSIVFASAMLTHFNTHYISRRVSLVFQPDKHLDSWIKAETRLLELLLQMARLKYIYTSSSSILLVISICGNLINDCHLMHYISILQTFSHYDPIFKVI